MTSLGMQARTIPILPCSDLDNSISFYEALGFRRTYRQLRPNPYAVVELGEISIHLFGIENFDPASSYGSAVILVADADALYADFADSKTTTGLARVIENAARLGDARGDDEAALSLIRSGLAKFPDSAAIDLVRALLYQSELYARIGNHDSATDSFRRALAIEVTESEQKVLDAEIRHVEEVIET